VKADLGRELGRLDVHWVADLGVTPGHWGNREPAPHGELVL
jgi:hypothetical protein